MNQNEVIKMLTNAIELHMKFWDEMPKGQLGKLSCNIGLLNDAFLKSSEALKIAKEVTK